MATSLLDELLGGPCVEAVGVQKGHFGGNRIGGFTGQPRQHGLRIQAVNRLVAGKEVIDALEQVMALITGPRQAENTPELRGWPLWRCQRQGRTPGTDGVMRQPESLPEIHWGLADNTGQKICVHAPQTLQTRSGNQGQFVRGRRINTKTESLAIAFGNGRCFGKQGNQFRGIRSMAQLLSQPWLIQYTGQMPENIQVFIGLGRNRNQHIHPRTIVPGDPLGELKNTDTGVQNRIPAFWCAVGNSDAITQYRGRLLFTGAHSDQIFRGRPAGALKIPSCLLQCILPVSGSCTQANVIGSQRQHNVCLAFCFDGAHLFLFAESCQHA